MKDIKALAFAFFSMLGGVFLFFIIVALSKAFAEPVSVVFKCGDSEIHSTQYEPQSPVVLTSSVEKGTYMQVPITSKQVILFYNLDTGKVIKMKYDANKVLHASYYSNVDYANANRPYSETKCNVGS